MGKTIETNTVERAQEELKLSSVKKEQEIRSFFTDGVPELSREPKQALMELSNELKTGEGAQDKICTAANDDYRRGNRAEDLIKMYDSELPLQLAENIRNGAWNIKII